MNDDIIGEIERFLLSEKIREIKKRGEYFRLRFAYFDIMEKQRELEERYNHNHDSKGRFTFSSGGSSKPGLTKVASGAKLKGGYKPSDIEKAIRQKSRNFVTRDINNPESLYGELIEKVKVDSKYYDIRCHGSNDSVKIFDSVIDEYELGRIIVMRGDFDERPILLLACETGKGENCFAQKLANIMGVDVYAPTEIIWASNSGKYSVGTNKDADDGKIKKFTPDKKGK